MLLLILVWILFFMLNFRSFWNFSFLMIWELDPNLYLDLYIFSYICIYEKTCSRLVKEEPFSNTFYSQYYPDIEPKKKETSKKKKDTLGQ